MEGQENNELFNVKREKNSDILQEQTFYYRVSRFAFLPFMIHFDFLYKHYG